MKAQAIKLKKKKKSRTPSGVLYYQIALQYTQVSCNNIRQIYFFCSHSGTWLRKLAHHGWRWVPEPRNGSAMAAHQVPQVTQRRPVNFHSSNSYVPAKHAPNQLELKRLFQSNMHNMRRGISVFINFCVHMCILVCVCMRVCVCVLHRGMLDSQ